MKKFLAIALFVMMLTPLKANAFDWGNFFRLLFFGGESTKSVTVEELNTTLKSAQEQSKTLDESIKSSFLAIVPLLTTQKDATKFEEEFKKINESNIADEKKKEQIFAKISEYTTTIKNNKVGVLLILKTGSDLDKTTLKNQIKKLSDDAEKYNELYKKCSDMTENVTISEENDYTIAITNMNKESEALKNKTEIVYSFVNQVKTLALLSGIKL